MNALYLLLSFVDRSITLNVRRESASTMSRNMKASIAIVAVFGAVLAAVVVLTKVTSDRDSTSAGPVASPSVSAASPFGDSAGVQVVRENSHRLSTAADGKVTFVEFLDFECEACKAAFPVVESLREQYKGKVTFVVRYFPLPGHFNGERAAVAVEAAAQQGKFEQMYKKMYETQSQWGEQRVPADAMFRSFAEELGLNMAQYDAAIKDPAVIERVRFDVREGEALGIQSTPTFFLNGQKIDPQSIEELKEMINAAVNG